MCVCLSVCLSVMAVLTVPIGVEEPDALGDDVRGPGEHEDDDDQDQHLHHLRGTRRLARQVGIMGGSTGKGSTVVCVSYRPARTYMKQVFTTTH